MNCICDIGKRTSVPEMSSFNSYSIEKDHPMNRFVQNIVPSCECDECEGCKYFYKSDILLQFHMDKMNHNIKFCKKEDNTNELLFDIIHEKESITFNLKPSNTLLPKDDFIKLFCEVNGCVAIKESSALGMWSEKEPKFILIYRNNDIIFKDTFIGKCDVKKELKKLKKIITNFVNDIDSNSKIEEFRL